MNELPSPRLVSRPRLEGWPLASIASLLLASLVLAGWSAHEKRQLAQALGTAAGLASSETPGVHRSRQLVFRDAADTSISVVDGQTGQPLQSIEGEAGFARSVLRSLARARLKQGLGPEQAFELRRTEAGGLVLSDPLTGHEVDLTALGPTNAAVFAVYLKEAHWGTRREK